MQHPVIHAVFDTLETSLADHPNLISTHVSIGEPMDYDITPGAERVELVVDGVTYAVTVEPIGEIQVRTSPRDIKRRG